MEKKYLPRLFDDILAFALKTKGAVIVTGPKWCGKSRTSSRFAKTKINMLATDTQTEYIRMAKLSPSIFLNLGPKPMLIDEWQIISFIWDAIKIDIDENSEFGRYILTGSTTDSSITNELSSQEHHSGTGRIVHKMMRTMSLYESGESNGLVSLKDIEKGRFVLAESKLSLIDYTFLICRGGWPLAIDVEKDVALQQAIDYVDGLVTNDIFAFKNVPLIKDEQRARRVLRSYARMIGSQASNKEIITDVAANDETFNVEVFSKYMKSLNQLFVIEELEAWNPNLRSKTAIRTKNTRHFVDPSIGAASLGISPDDLLKDFKTFGLYFESLAIRDLRIYSEAIGAKVYHYRDKKDREVDAVITFRNGDWALIEIKLGDEEEIDIAAKKLVALSSDINEERKAPSFLAVITTGKLSYQREDGVYVIPLGCLKN